jgi:hypothetical protein
MRRCVAMALLQGVELPALEDGCANKSLLVRPNLFLCDSLHAYVGHIFR